MILRGVVEYDWSAKAGAASLILRHRHPKIALDIESPPTLAETKSRCEHEVVRRIFGAPVWDSEPQHGADHVIPVFFVAGCYPVFGQKGLVSKTRFLRLGIFGQPRRQANNQLKALCRNKFQAFITAKIVQGVAISK